MTDAPDRIRTNPQGTALVTDFGRWETDVEYHRADLTAAAVAAALQGAADAMKPDEMSTLCRGFAANYILSQIDPTGLTALEARDARVRAKALEEAWAFIAATVAEWRNDVPMTGEECAAAIRAMANPTAKEGGE